MAVYGPAVPVGLMKSRLATWMKEDVSDSAFWDIQKEVIINRKAITLDVTDLPTQMADQVESAAQAHGKSTEEKVDDVITGLKSMGVTRQAFIYTLETGGYPDGFVTKCYNVTQQYLGK